MRFLVLGPLEVREEGGDPLPIAGSKERMILACLVARAGRVVSVDDLIVELWGEHPPRTAEKTLSSYVSRLRRALQPGRPPGSKTDVIVSRGDGYSLERAGDEVDAIRFERLAAEGHRLLDAGNPGEASPVLEEALGLWRGAAYQGHRYTGFGAAEGGTRAPEKHALRYEARVLDSHGPGRPPADRNLPDLLLRIAPE